MTKPTLAQSAHTLAAILSAILKMSDDVKNARSALDQQGKLLFMQNSIQKNGSRVLPYVEVIMEALKSES